jgi:trimethylamine--corrinoid protein Co-methyltransferase
LHAALTRMADDLRRLSLPLIAASKHCSDWIPICTTDMRWGSAAVGSPETALDCAGAAAMAAYYEIPSWTAGCVSDSVVSDIQIGREKTLTGLVAQLAGASVIHRAGMLESGVTFDLAQLVMDTEIAAPTKCVRNGVPVGDATTATEVIIEVGPAKHYLERKTTPRECTS